MDRSFLPALRFPLLPSSEQPRSDDYEYTEERLVETERRLSESMLWSLQRSYFHRKGIDAWRTPEVPHYVTNNPALASAYAEVVAGYLRDCALLPFDTSIPVTILELGAGTGRFAYLFLKELLAIRSLLPPTKLRFRYVMTDFTETNIEFWRSHELLKPFVEEGLLDFASFDAERDSSLQLLCSGEELSPRSSPAPLIVIGNYVFDGLSQDLFFFSGRELHEVLIALVSAGPPVPEIELLSRVEPRYSRRPASLPYYEEPGLDNVLERYVRTLEGVTLSFPCAAIRCLERLAQLAGPWLFVLSGDRGTWALDALVSTSPPELTHHGSVSMKVNYHALAEHIRERGGAVLHPSHQQVHLSVVAFLLGPHPTGFAETRLAFDRSIERGGPDDFFTLRSGIQRDREHLSTEQLLSLIRLSRWDPRILSDAIPILWERAGGASLMLKEQVILTIRRTWQNYYPIGEAFHLAFECGLLLYALDSCSEALTFFEHSLRHEGNDPRTHWNMGLCHYGLGQVEEATRCFTTAAALDPSFRPTGLLEAKPPIESRPLS